MRLQARIGCIVSCEGRHVAGRLCDRVGVAVDVRDARRLLAEAVRWDVDILVVDREFFRELRDDIYAYRRKNTFPVIVEGAF